MTVGDPPEFTYYTSWGGQATSLDDLDAGIAELQTNLPIKAPKITIGTEPPQPPLVGQMRLVSDGTTPARISLVLERYDGAGWVNLLTLRPGSVDVESLGGNRTSISGNRIDTDGYVSADGDVSAGGSVTAGPGGLRAPRGGVNVGLDVEGRDVKARRDLGVAGDATITGDTDIDGTLTLDTIADVKRAIDNLYTWAVEVRAWQVKVNNHQHLFQDHHGLTTGFVFTYPPDIGPNRPRIGTNVNRPGPGLGDVPTTPTP